MGARQFLALAQGAYGALLACQGTSVDRRRATRLLADALQVAEELGRASREQPALPGHPPDPDQICPACYRDRDF